MDLTNYVPTPLSKMSARFNEAKYDPTMLIKASLETVEEITNGKALLTDATSPMVLQMEMGATLAAACVQEAVATLRKQYAVLAQGEEDLYLHMSDEDFLGRFASPADPVSFTFCIQVTDLVREAVYDPVEKVSKLIIPRDTTFSVDGVDFTLLYPVVVRYFDNRVLQISYDVSIANPIHTLKSTLIDVKIRQGTELEEWAFFDVAALQVAVGTEYFTVDKTYNFKKTIEFTNLFYTARVYYKNDSTAGKWKEIETTHTDQVFNIKKPTAVLKVVDSALTVEIPVIYTTSDLISGSVRIDLYTTKGEMALNLKNYRPDSIQITLKAIDEARDLSVYTEAMANVSYYAYSSDYVSGGAGEVPFSTLCEQVIYNATGPNDVPITNVQLTAEATQADFNIVKNVDVLTNRIFLATRKLPLPTQRRLITPANIGMIGFYATLAELDGHYKVVNNGDRTTFLSKALWLSQNGQLKLVSKADIDQLYALGQTAMLNQINSSQYYYTPFYYVLDSSGDEFELRSYSLDLPYGKDQNFLRLNQTLQLTVNTGSYLLTKVAQGYRLRITTQSGGHYKALEDTQVGVQLAFYPDGETTLAYINGTFVTTDVNGERVFDFIIKSNHDIDGSNLLKITNGSVQGITNYQSWVKLETKFNLLHYTTSVSENFVSDETDSFLGKFLLPSTAVGNAHEELTLHFGDTLDNLWRRSRSYMTNMVYRRHETDVPLQYTEDIYDVDQATGSIFSVNGAGELVYLIKHHKGDPVIDENGNPVFKFRAGDIMLNEQNEPVVDTSQVVGRQMDILVADGRYFFSDDVATINYRSELEEVLADWIVNDLQVLENRLLDITELYFYPETSLGDVEVQIDNNEKVYIPAEQTLNLTLYVKSPVHSNEDIRAKLSSSSISLLSTEVGKKVINMTEIKELLKTLFGSSVAAFNLTGLGGDKDYQFLTVTSDQNRLCLKKRLVVQADRTLFVEDAVNVEFKLVS